MLHKPLNTVLNIVLFGLGMFIVVILLLIGKQLEQNLSNNAKGIDLVVGAKGSPMQIVLSSVFHIDYPTGNIKLYEAEKLAKNRYVKNIIPMALGDAYNGHRIVGTSHAYLEQFEAEVVEGEIWQEHMEVVLGSNVAHNFDLYVGDEFMGQHGLIPEGGYDHEGHGYHIVGILKRSGSVVDNLILTSPESVWEVHGVERSNQQDEDKNGVVSSRIIPSVNMHSADSTKELTTLLITYRSPMAAMQLPRFINQNTSMQAASPAFEMARLLTIVGVGVELLEAFGYLIIIIAMLSIFVALYSALKERRYDLAIMRAMGASRRKLFVGMIVEGLIITFFGAVLGMSIAHILIEVLSGVYQQTGNIMFSGQMMYMEEGVIFIVSMLVGVISAVIPAYGIYKVDISKVLADE